MSQVQSIGHDLGGGRPNRTMKSYVIDERKKLQLAYYRRSNNLIYDY